MPAGPTTASDRGPRSGAEARPRRTRRAGGPCGEQGKVRGEEGQGIARKARRRREPQADIADHEENGLSSAYGKKRFKAHPGKPNETELPSLVAREFNGRAPRTHVCSDLTYVRVAGSRWCYVCLLVDLYNREIVGHSAGARKDGAAAVEAAFATLEFPVSDIEVFHTDCGSEFDNAEIDLMLEAFGVERSLSAKGCPYDNAAGESANRILKAEFVYREGFSTSATCNPSCPTTSTGRTTSGSTQSWAT